MKTATYTSLDGIDRTVEYDENAPCVICSLPVLFASMGGTAVCPWCDCGNYRDGCRWAFRFNHETQKLEPVFPHPEHQQEAPQPNIYIEEPHP